MSTENDAGLRVLPHRHIVVGTDGSATATLALNRAASMARLSTSRLTVVTAYERGGPGDQARVAAVERMPEQTMVDDVSWQASAAATAERVARAAVEEARSTGVADASYRVEEGDPATMLLEVADEVGADLLVVGSKGMRSLSRFVLGSVPNKVSHRAPCDVLIVHTDA